MEVLRQDLNLDGSAPSVLALDPGAVGLVGPAQDGLAVLVLVGGHHGGDHLPHEGAVLARHHLAGHAVVDRREQAGVVGRDHLL